MATRMKIKTLTQVPQSHDECAAHIARLGQLQRDFERLRADMNDQISVITEAFAPLLSAQQQQLDALHAGVQAWCEAHRVQLCGEDDRRGKTASFVTGSVAWRIRPPSVRLSNEEGVIDTLLQLRLERFVRTSARVNKEAVLAEPEAVRGIRGLAVQSGLEDFIVTPLEIAEGA